MSDEYINERFNQLESAWTASRVDAVNDLKYMLESLDDADPARRDIFQSVRRKFMVETAADVLFAMTDLFCWCVEQWQYDELLIDRLKQIAATHPDEEIRTAARSGLDEWAALLARDFVPTSSGR